jgi:hypothetical protein
MTLCVKCGTRNPDDKALCANCGASLVTGKYADDPPHRDECFGLPGGNAIPGIIFGLIVVLLGISWLLGLQFWQLFWNVFWGLVLIVVGIWIVTKTSRRR